jgi:hypothetical protein
VTKSPVKLSDLFRYYKQLPHQMAAIVELEAALLKVAPDAFNKDQPWFKTWSQAGKQPRSAGCGLILRAKSSLSLKGAVLSRTYVPLAYPRRAMAVLAAALRLESAPITQAQADQWLAEDLQRFADGIHRLLPGSQLVGRQPASSVDFMGVQCRTWRG